MKTLLSKLTGLLRFKRNQKPEKKKLLIIHEGEKGIENIYAPPGSPYLVVILSEHRVWHDHGYNKEQMAAFIDQKTKGMEPLEIFGRDCPPSLDSNY